MILVYDLWTMAALVIVVPAVIVCGFVIGAWLYGGDDDE